MPPTKMTAIVADSANANATGTAKSNNTVKDSKSTPSIVIWVSLH